METNYIKNIVKSKYGEIAKKSAKTSVSSCCSCGCGPEPDDYSTFNDDYRRLGGYVPDADLNLGCGLPTEHAGIKAGDTVVDLGSGAGNDVFVARSLTGGEGKVIGIDMTPEMLELAEKNKTKLGFDNVEFRLGEIEALPVDDKTADVVISNCVLNLVPDKKKAFDEIYRILKPGARFCVSDVVLDGELPNELKESAQMYAGCVAGALQQKDYLEAIRQSGFNTIEIKTKKRIDLPDSVLKEYLSKDEINSYRESGTGIFSITVTGNK